MTLPALSSPRFWRFAGTTMSRGRGATVLQADTEKTSERPSSNALTTRTVGLRVSSSYIRREASRNASGARHAKIVGDRFAILRTRILREMRKHGWRRLAVVPITSGAGATFVAVQLSLALSRQRHTDVILADLDLGNPSIAGALGIPGCEPISDLLLQRRQIIDATAIIDEAPNLWVMAPDSKEEDPAEILQDESLAAALDAWRGLRPEAIEIFDTAPLLSGDAALATLPLADAILLVADGLRGTASDMTQAERLLKDMPPIMGVVLNKSED